MPQMSPLNWMFLYFLFILIFFLFMIITYYQFLNNNINNKSLFKKKNYNWKW
uniref:ATP synthase complex subunit 8 n=1 Tax=Discolomatidae sp. 4 ACP-2013 TaxID=1434487 RepID=A0A3G3FWE7_9CUCU|nr:ATP synthase F0 subunit 8 [Discolomatidae sp. 4 ACP-2013]